VDEQGVEALLDEQGIEPGKVLRLTAGGAFLGLVPRLAPTLQQPDELVPGGGLITALGQFNDLALQAQLKLRPRFMTGPVREVARERIALSFLVKWHRFTDPSDMAKNPKPAAPIRGSRPSLD
jgi:hypothetical protein